MSWYKKAEEIEETEGLDITNLMEEDLWRNVLKTSPSHYKIMPKHLQRKIQNPLVSLAAFMSFTNQYIKTAIEWSAKFSGNQRENVKLWNDKNIEQKSLEQIYQDCNDFLTETALTTQNSFSTAGMDFWFSRNGMASTGFKDGFWGEEIGNELDEIAQSFGGSFLVEDKNGRLEISPVLKQIDNLYK